MWKEAIRRDFLWSIRKQAQFRNRANSGNGTSRSVDLAWKYTGGIGAAIINQTQQSVRFFVFQIGTFET